MFITTTKDEGNLVSLLFRKDREVFLQNYHLQQLSSCRQGLKIDIAVEKQQSIHW